MDALTGALNRRALQEQYVREVARAARRSHPLTVVAVDMDGLKQRNDRFGHAAGDDAIRRLARDALDCVRVTDVVARTGGDEFVLVLPDADEEVAHGIMRRLDAALARDSSREGRVHFSYGAVTFAQPPPLEAAIEQADRRLYDAKRRRDRSA